MSNPLDRFIKWTDELQANLDAIAKSLADVLRPGTALRAFVDAWPTLQVRLDKMSAAVRDSFKRAGFPPCRQLSLDDLVAIEQAFASDGIEASAALVERLCYEAVNHAEIRQEMLDDWAKNPLTASRVGVLEEALKAHHLKLYAVSIPPFLAHLEGIIADGKHPSDKRMHHKKMKEYVEELAKGDELMGTLISDFVGSVILAEFFRGDLMPDFSRHAILHGADNSYGTESNSTKAILTFDYVQDLLRPTGESRPDHS